MSPYLIFGTVRSVDVSNIGERLLNFFLFFFLGHILWMFLSITRETLPLDESLLHQWPRNFFAIFIPSRGKDLLHSAPRPSPVCFLNLVVWLYKVLTLRWNLEVVLPPLSVYPWDPSLVHRLVPGIRPTEPGGGWEGPVTRVETLETEETRMKIKQ